LSASPKASLHRRRSCTHVELLHARHLLGAWAQALITYIF
jgi:hypothetical protein